MSPSAPSDQRISPTGLAFAVGSYGLWGLLPLFFVATIPTGPVELVAWRIVLSLVFCLIIIAIVRGWSRLWAILRSGRAMALLAAASVFILVNWLVYVFAALNGHVVEASLGCCVSGCARCSGPRWE